MNRAEERLLNPPPGGRIEAARHYGIDLTLLIERLRKTPEERVRDLQRAAADLKAVRGKAAKGFRGNRRSAPDRLRDDLPTLPSCFCQNHGGMLSP